MSKKLFILAGPNGSGKSTLYRKLIGKYKTLSNLPFVNPDDIAKELFGDFLPNGSNESNRKMPTEYHHQHSSASMVKTYY